jgi:magnesium transporter
MKRARMTETEAHPARAGLTELLGEGRWYPLRRKLADLHPADLAEFVADLPPREQGLVLRLAGRRQGEVFACLKAPVQYRILRNTPPEQLDQIIRMMRPDDRTRFLGLLPAQVTHAILGRMPVSELKQGLALLGYPEATAGRYMTPEFASVLPTMTASEALEHIRRTGRGKETLNVLYLVDEDGRFVEDLRLGALVLADPGTRVTDIPDPGMVVLLDTDPVAEVLRAFSKYSRVALPVVDASRRLLGIITIDDVADLAEARHTREIQKMGGVEALDLPYVDSGFWAMVRKRGGWLAVLFFGEMLTATAMGHYEKEIARAVVLALFVPLIISTGGNSGSQATSLIIRSLALQELRLRDWFRVFQRELLSGLALGGGLGAIGFTRIMLWQRMGLADYGVHHVRVAATVWVSLAGVVTFGTLSGSMLPFLLRRLGFDPATSSAPFVATLVDVTGLVIYFQVASYILRGAIL